MAKAQAAPETTLQLKRQFAAPRARVFRAWTDAKDLANWFAPSPDHSTVVTELDLRVGGKYRIEIRHKSGNVHTVTGAYREIAPPERVVYTWRWEADPTAHESLVTVEFEDLGPATEVTITHEQLPNAEERDKHNHGWVGCTDKLSKYLEEQN